MTSRGAFGAPTRALTALVVAGLAGCIGQIGDLQPTSGSGGSTGIGVSGAGGSTGNGIASDLPCDVGALLASKCVLCHGHPPAGGAPVSLTNYAELTATAKSDPTKNEAVLAVARMMSTSSPMPPAGLTPATSAEIASLQSWISAGYPTTGCATAIDAGSGPDPTFTVAPTCTSGVTWNGGSDGSGSMDPGKACISCHASTGGEAPRFAIAGTLYPTAHEPDLCYGVNGTTDGAKVVITDANGTVTSITPNSAGNFYSSATVVTPYRAKVTYMGRERDMAATQTSGDCNSCHTQSGTMSAPGRIVLP
jgi:hypothetical protein